jgi:hypothetical protein
MTGDGVPEGMLMLTTKRLFFFSKGRGKSKSNLILRMVPGAVASALVPAKFEPDLFDKIVGQIVEKLEYNDKIEDFLNDETSFVVPLQRILSCEKFGNISDALLPSTIYHTLPLTSKRRYLRIGIEDTNKSKVDYCIYCMNPKNPLDNPVNIKKWYKQIMDARAQATERDGESTNLVSVIHENVPRSTFNRSAISFFT